MASVISFDTVDQNIASAMNDMICGIKADDCY